MTRLKPDQITTLEEFFSHVDAAAKLSAESEKLGAERDLAIQQIQDPANATINANKAEIERHLNLAQPYAERHRSALLGKRKSASTNLAVWGFRKKTGLAIKDPNALLKMLEKAKRISLLTVKTSLDKAAIKKAVESGQKIEGAAVASADVFFVEPKTDRAELAGE